MEEGKEVLLPELVDKIGRLGVSLGTQTSPTTEDRLEALERALEQVSLQTSDSQRKIKIEVDALEQSLKARETYATEIWKLCKIWLGFVALVIVVHSFGWAHLSDSVLSTLLTTTTITVLGLFTIVIGHFFNKAARNDEPK